MESFVGADVFGCSHSHAITQTIPSDAVTRKLARQPYARARYTKTGGPMTAEILVPELKTPVAKARSLPSNHSATDLIAAGKLQDSLKPSTPRHIAN